MLEGAEAPVAKKRRPGPRQGSQTMQNFLGQYECAIDSKGRMMIPAKFRRMVSDDSGGQFVITMGKERCLNLYPLEEWNETVLSRLHSLPPGADKRNYIRFYSRKSRNLVLDKAGRVVLPAAFLEALGNPKKVTVMGALSCIEIWAPGDYEAIDRVVDGTFLDGDFEY